MALVDTFSQSQFLIDFKKTADAIEAPYSEPAIQRALDTFDECFKNSTVIWRTTNRPNDVLNYRFYLLRRLDTVKIARDAGLLAPENKMARLVTCWSALFNGDTQQWCDFHPKEGLAKTWVNLNGQRPVDDIINATEVPEVVRSHLPEFHRLGLKVVRFLAVDYDGETMNLYFTGPGPITESQAADYTALAQCSPPTEQEFQDMKEYLNPTGFAFAVTMDYNTGKITRVAFYALRLPRDAMPKINDRMKTFFEEAPCLNKVYTRNVAWSYGIGDKKYMKAEANYLGDLADVLQKVGSPMASI